jgi:hypothetical protein
MGVIAPAGKPKRAIRQQWVATRSAMFSHKGLHDFNEQKRAARLRSALWDSSSTGFKIMSLTQNRSHHSPLNF